MGNFAAQWTLGRRAGTLALAIATAALPQTKPTLASRDRPGESVAITNVTVIDVVTGARRTGVTVLTRGDRITAISPKVVPFRGERAR